MPDTPVTPPAGGNTPPAPTPTPTPNPSPSLIAGKFKDEAAFTQGFREIHKALGLPEIPADKAIFGDGTPFANLDAAVAGYKHFEGLYGRRQPQGDPTKKPATPVDLGITPAAPTELAPDADVNAIVKRAGLTQEEIQTSWTKDGKLSDDQYAKFHKIGIPKTVVDQHLQLQTQAIATKVQQVTAKAAEYAGGPEKLAALRDWAAANMEPDELKMLSDTVSKNPDYYPVMIQIVAARHASKVGASNGTMVPGTSAGVTGGITTRADWLAATKAASNGDKAAQARIAATPLSRIQSLS